MDTGREGMGTTLHTLMAFLITKLPTEYRLKGLVGDNLIGDD